MSLKEILLLLVLYSSFQALILAFVFFMKRENKNANKLFSYFMLLFSFHLIFNYLHWKDLMYQEPLIYFGPLKPMVWLLYGPLLYLYFKHSLGLEKFRIKDVVHLAPVLVYYFATNKYLFLTTEKRLDLIHSGKTGAFVPIEYSFIYIGCLWLYLIIIYNLLFRKYELQKNIKIWASCIFLSFSVYVFAMSSIFIGVFFDFFQINGRYEYLIGLLIMLPVWVVTYFAYIQPSVFLGKSVLYPFNFIKYKKSGLTRSYSMELRNNLLHLFSEEKLYAKSDLSLESLSVKLETTRHNTSQVINEYFKCNFFEFINNYRIEEAKRILKHDTLGNFTILDVALEVGFNNRVTFNKIFKEKTKLTPSEYRRSVVKSFNGNPKKDTIKST
ncbi:MAG: helix-turn-helix domain-containing protein [Bacteroidota bacterium]